ncbi:MAG: chloride channel protein [Agarilytica sp.]
MSKRFAEFRHSLSYIDALPQLTLLGFFVGILTGFIIVGFRWLIDLPLLTLLPNQSENFEALSLQSRLLLIGSGIGLLMILFSFLKPKEREMSVSHVLDRMHNHQAKLPFKNWLGQFAGAIVCLATGQSVGREGPVVHLGAGAASQFGQWLNLPNNSTHILVGCGVAAAISASFDTPMAGVIFAMEILVLEYTIVGFVPIILASVTGTVMSKALIDGPGFSTASTMSLQSLLEIPVVVLVGAFIAICAGIYIRLNIFALKMARYPLNLRLTIAGVLSALTIIWVPQVMGQGYDTVNAAMHAELLISTLAIVALAKLLLTPIVVGLGVPGGLIGPLLVIGACVGGAIGHIISYLFPALGADPGFYVMMGMAGMVAAVLNAPLTALVTVLELTYNPNIIFPAMLVIVVACLTTRQVFRVKGIFVEQLLHSNRPLDFGPAKQALKRAGVRSVMDSRFVLCEQKLTLNKARLLLANHPMWLIIEDENQRYTQAMRAADLANHLNTFNGKPETESKDSEIKNSEAETDQSSTEDDSIIIDIHEIPSRMFRVGAVHESASLHEAMQGFKAFNSQVLYVSGKRTPDAGDIKGVLTFNSIENYYKPEEFKNVVD